MVLRRKRGLLLITVLFFAILVTMFASAALVLAPSSLARSAADSSLAGADLAARSGVDWVRSRISQDPQWNAKAAQTFSMPGLRVTEGQGQVVGWVQEASGWARFRIRFNYQDGPASTANNSDNLNDPSTPWDDFTFLSCNNLIGSGERPLPEARNGSATSSSAPWTNTQLTIPAASLLLTVEGTGGPVETNGSGQPTGFSGVTHRRTAQALLKFGDNQPTTDAAIMAAGDLHIKTFGPAPVGLSALAGQVARLRTKGTLTLGDVNSDNGDLRHVYGCFNGTSTGSVSVGSDAGTDGFYQIPANKVRTPTGSLTMNAGTYVVTHDGKVMFYNMNYKNYVTATSPPTGVEVTLPTGMTLTGPSDTPPRYRITVTGDLKINASSTVTDFAIIPDGGAAQSDSYGGIPPTAPPAQTPLPSPLASPGGPFSDVVLTEFVNGPMGISGSTSYTGPVGITGPQTSAWFNLITMSVTAMVIDTATGNTIYQIDAGANAYRSPAGAIEFSNLNQGSLFNMMALVVGTTNGNQALLDLFNSYGFVPTAWGGGGPSGSPPPTSGSPPASGGAPLLPADLELDLQGGTAGLVISNSQGSLIFGSQIKGNGAALVAKKDIALIGTSSDLSSDPGAALGLNLYAEGQITIDAFKLDPNGLSSFHGINLHGVIYAWNGVQILAGNATTSAPFSMVGSMVAYGGNPANAPQPGTAEALIEANSAGIQFDPSYVAGLVSHGPFTMTITAWHEF